MLSQLSSDEERQLRSKRFLKKLYDFPEGIKHLWRYNSNSLKESQEIRQ